MAENVNLMKRSEKGNYQEREWTMISSAVDATRVITARERNERLWMRIAQLTGEAAPDLKVWRSQKNYDNTTRKGYFILGVFESKKFR